MMNDEDIKGSFKCERLIAELFNIIIEKNIFVPTFAFLANVSALLFIKYLSSFSFVEKRFF